MQTNLAAVGNIVSQATDMLLTARAENSEVDIENLIRKNMDAIAIMGHISYDLAQRRRDVIRPTLNKEYATLCASHVPVTTLLFGDELQTQLSHIRASNKKKIRQVVPNIIHQGAISRLNRHQPDLVNKSLFYGNSRLRTANPNIGESTNNIGPINRGIRKINEQHFDRIAGKHIQYTLTFLASLS